MSALREVTWRDIPQLAALETELFADDAWTVETWWAELAGRPRRAYLVLDGEGGVEGYAGLDHGGDVADVMTVAVVPAHRGRGLGDLLLEELLRLAADGGAEAVMLEVRADNWRRDALYERHGFERVVGAPAVLPAAGRARCGRRRHAEPTGGGGLACGMSRWSSVSRPPATRPASASSAAQTLLADAVASQCRRARPVRRRGAGGRQPRPPRGDGARRSSGPAASRASRLADVDAIAVTAGPGLAGALLVGVAAAKALAVGLGKPLYGVNHLAAHVAVDVVEHGPLPEPCLALLVCGGHSSLLLVADVTADVRPLGATIDDAAGEAFDKVARVLGLPFPGGPYIDRAAREGDRSRSTSPAG